jgi:hypothetical protein
VYCYNHSNGNDIKGFRALWDNIYDYMPLLLQILPPFLMVNLLVSYTTAGLKRDVNQCQTSTSVQH